MIDNILRYFPRLSDDQRSKLEQLYPLYEDWNSKINVLSRKDFENFYTHHVLHSLSIYKYHPFKRGSQILDLGTGGGFPAIPLAIMMPDVHFVAVDSIHKKTKVVEAVAEALELKNLKTVWGRAESIDQKFDFIVSRAVAPLTDLIYWSKQKIHPISFNELANGLITLKGGDLKQEIMDASRRTLVRPISDFFKEDFFETKMITYTKL